MHPALSRLEHRPWPLPRQPWTWRQNWYDLLFAHWPIATSSIRRLVPDGLAIQEFNGTSWIGVVPFRMTGVMRRPLPDLPWVSAFPELNVRLYVERDGIPGVYFLSLDAANPLAVWAARRFFHLPYWHSRMQFKASADDFVFRSERRAATVRFSANYRPTSPVRESQPGTLEHFLTERYCLYACSPAGVLYRADVHHHPWPLQDGAGELDPTELLQPFGLSVGSAKPLLHFSRGVDVVVWSPERVS